MEQLEFQAYDLRSDEQESGISRLQIDYIIGLGHLNAMIKNLGQ